MQWNRWRARWCVLKCRKHLNERAIGYGAKRCAQKTYKRQINCRVGRKGLLVYYFVKMTIQNWVHEYNTNKAWEERYSHDMGTYDVSELLEDARKKRERYEKIPTVTVRFWKYNDYRRAETHPWWFQILIARRKNKNYSEWDIIYTRSLKLLFRLPIRRE